MLMKKHFKAIAEIIKAADKAKELRYAGSVARRFIDYFATQNPNFNRQKFFDACGL